MIAGDATTPNQVAERLIGRSYLSYSAVNLFRACPLRFKFRYLDGLSEEFVSAALVFGSAIHRAAELHYERMLSGSPLPSLDELLLAYHESWQSQLQTGRVQFASGDELTSLAQLATRMLAAFQASSIAQPRGSLLGIEEELRGTIIPGVPDLLGRIDLLYETDDTVVITDLKTSRARWTQEQAEAAGEQLYLYSELVKNIRPGKKLKMQFVVLTKTKEPAIEVHELPYQPARVDRIKRVVESVWGAINAAHFYPAPSPIQCSSCPFHAPCQAWRG